MRSLRLLCVAACSLLLPQLGLLAATTPQPNQPQVRPSPAPGQARPRPVRPRTRGLRPPPTGARRAPSRSLRQLVIENNDFALRLYQRVRTERGNLVLSPYSISTALAMTYDGTAGATKRQMAQVLGFYSLGAYLDPAFADLQTRLTTRPPAAQGGTPLQLHVANALWAQQGHQFLRSYTEALRMYYGGGLETVDFRAPDKARLTINQWVGKQTAGKITDLLPAGLLNVNTRLVLTNAIYFNAVWEHPFPVANTRPGDFALLTGQRVQTSLMRETFAATYAKGQGYQVVEVPYQGRQLSMFIVLPDAGKFATFEAALTGGRARSVLSGLRQTRVDLTMPKFRYEAQFSLARTLAAMGMPDAFEAKRADFSGMDGKRDLFLQAVLHKALIRVDENGTEAAAATGVAVGVTAVAPGEVVPIVVDRPFLYLVRDNLTGSLLFLGWVVDPRA